MEKLVKDGYVVAMEMIGKDVVTTLFRCDCGHTVCLQEDYYSICEGCNRKYKIQVEVSIFEELKI